MTNLINSKFNSILLSIILIAGTLFQIHFLYQGTFTQYADGDHTTKVKKGGEIVKPNASNPFPNAKSVKFTWLQTKGDPVDIELSNQNKSMIFTTPIRPYGQIIEFDFKVTSEEGNKSGHITYAVEPEFPPIANAGIDRVISTGEICNSQGQNNTGSTPPATSIILDGRNSTDNDPESLKYEWTQIAGPLVRIDNYNNKMTNFEIDLCRLLQDTTFVFNLNVKDRLGQEDFDNTTVLIDVERALEKRPLDPYSSNTIISGLSQARELFNDNQPSNPRFNEEQIPSFR